MRNFIDVLKKITKMSDDVELTQQFDKIYEDTTFTAPENWWEIRGRQVSDALYNYSVSNKRALEDWFVSLVAEFTQKTNAECIEFIKSVNKGNLCKTYEEVVQREG